MILSWRYSNLTPSGSHSQLYSITIGSTDSYIHSIPPGLVTSKVQSGCYLSLTPSGSLSLNSWDTISCNASYLCLSPTGLFNWCGTNFNNSRGVKYE